MLQQKIEEWPGQSSCKFNTMRKYLGQPFDSLNNFDLEMNNIFRSQSTQKSVQQITEFRQDKERPGIRLFSQKNQQSSQKAPRQMKRLQYLYENNDQLRLPNINYKVLNVNELDTELNKRVEGKKYIPNTQEVKSYDINKVMGQKVNISQINCRNGIGYKNLGDKYYGEVERSDKYYCDSFYPGSGFNYNQKKHDSNKVVLEDKYKIQSIPIEVTWKYKLYNLNRSLDQDSLDEAEKLVDQIQNENNIQKQI